MRSSCKIDYYSKPFDYQISKNAYRKIFEDRDREHFSITIEDVTYNFTLKMSPESDIDYIVKSNKNGKQSSKNTDAFSVDDVSEFSDKSVSSNSDSSPSKISQTEKRELLRRLFLGKSIMVDYLNYSFLQQAANTIGIPELSQIKDLTNKSCAQQSSQFIFPSKKGVFYLIKSCKSFFFHFWTNLYNFVCFFGFFGRVLHTMWDLSGPTMVFCLFLNLLILFVTMALVTLKDYLVWFFIVVIPFLLYSFYFPNIICISIIEALQCNVFKRRTFFYSHQKLVIFFVKIVFDNKENLPKFYDLGSLHSFVHGILFLIFAFGFFAAMMNVKAPRFLNVWLIIFVFYVPLIRYFSLYIFYLIHSILSLFEGPRRKFLEIADFDDPFLSSFYLNERSWIDFFLAKGKKEKLANGGRLLIRFIFSKTTFSILATLAVIIYMFCAETKMSAGQVCITIFIGVCMIFVLATRITFPFFWINRRRDRKLTEGKIEEMRENIAANARKKYHRYSHVRESESQYEDNSEENDVKDSDGDVNESDSDGDVNDSESENDVSELECGESEVKLREKTLREEALNWHRQATTWSKRYVFLRWTSLILVVLTFVFVVVLLSVGGSTAVGTSNDKIEYDDNLTISRNWTNATTTTTADYMNWFHSSNVKSHHLDEVTYFDTSEVNQSNETIRFPASPVCSLRPKGLSITEIIALTMLANPPAPDNFTEGQWFLVDEFLGSRGEVDKDVVFVNTPFPWDNSFLSSMTLTRFRREPKLSVFTIRGTANPQDIIADAEIWFASVVINIMDAFFPFVNLYSEEAMELIGVVTNLPRYAFKQFSLVEEYKNRFTDYIYEYVYGETPQKMENQNFLNDRKLRRNLAKSKKPLKLPFHIDPDEEVMIIGHSLGGGLAKIISLVTGIQAVAISGPGIRFIGHFYRNKTVKNVEKTIVDVIPGQDLIARVDMTLGTQIHVPCRAGLNCHDTFRLICQVAVMCNEFQKHEEFCRSLFDEDAIDEMFEIGEVVK